MRKKSMHVVLMASVLVFSSIAGCLGNVDDDEAGERIHFGDLKKCVAFF